MKPEKLTNEQVVTIAIYYIGGVLEPVHSEDIAVKAFDLAPDRFRWQLDKYKENINLAYVYNSLTDARKAQNGALITGSISKGWLLTAEGVKLCKKFTSENNEIGIKKRRHNDPEKQAKEAWKFRQTSRILNNDVFLKILSNEKKDISKSNVMSFFQIDDYLQNDSKNKRVQQYRAIFFDDPKLAELVNKMASLYEENYAKK